MQYSNNPLEIVFIFFRRHKTFAKLLGIVLVILSMLICWKIGSNHEDPSFEDYYYIPDSQEEMDEAFPDLAVTKLDQQTDSENTIEINLEEEEQECVISDGGNYLLKGELKGRVYINAEEQNVHLFLDGATILSEKGPAIYCEKAEKIVITLLPSTENIISDSGNYLVDEEMEACIYSTCDLTVNGSGKLSVNAFYRDAIRSKDMVKIIDGVYDIKCKRTGIHGNDGVVIRGGNLTINSEKNGLKTTKKGKGGRGNLIVSGCEMSIIAGRFAFVTTKADLFVYDCTIYEKSIVNAYDVGGVNHVQKGCVQ